MIDATTRKPLHVSTDGTAGPHIMLPVRKESNKVQNDRPAEWFT